MLKLPIYVSSFILLLASCDSEPDSLMVNDKTYIEIEAEKIRNPSSISEVFYSIPSPNEQYELLFDLNDTVLPTVINSLSNFSQYNTESKKALNYGVYISDLTYLTRYNQDKKVFSKYISTLEHLEKDLNMTKVYGKELKKQVEEIEDHNEGLLEISSQNYISIYNELLKDGKNIELALILSGSWIETMHILFASSITFNGNAEVQAYIVDQHLILKNLIGFVEKCGDDKRLEPLMEYFNKISKIYTKLECKDSNLEIENDEGSILLNGGPTCVFTSDSYKEMKTVIKEIRTTIIS